MNQERILEKAAQLVEKYHLNKVKDYQFSIIIKGQTLYFKDMIKDLEALVYGYLIHMKNRDTSLLLMNQIIHVPKHLVNTPGYTSFVNEALNIIGSCLTSTLNTICAEGSNDIEVEVDSVNLKNAVELTTDLLSCIDLIFDASLKKLISDKMLFEKSFDAFITKNTDNPEKIQSLKNLLDIRIKNITENEPEIDPSKIDPVGGNA